jgi:hypothetical protein
MSTLWFRSASDLDTTRDEELRTDIDRWARFMRYAGELGHVPPSLEAAPCAKAFEIAELGKMTPAEREACDGARHKERITRGAIEHGAMTRGGEKRGNRSIVSGVGRSLIPSLHSGTGRLSPGGRRRARCAHVQPGDEGKPSCDARGAQRRRSSARRWRRLRRARSARRCGRADPSRVRFGVLAAPVRACVLP